MHYNDNLSLIVGRFNPLTVHHLAIITAMKGQKLIMVTGTSGPNDPLAVDDKINFMKSTIHKIDPSAMILHARNVIDALEIAGDVAQKNGVSNNITLHCGSDRADGYRRLNTYTNQTGVVIKDIIIHSREDDRHSATHLRALANAKNWNGFQGLCGYSNIKDVASAYKMIQAQKWKHTK